MQSKLVVVPLTREASQISQEIVFDAGTSGRVQKRVVEIIEAAEQDPACITSRASWAAAIEAEKELEERVSALAEHMARAHAVVIQRREELHRAILADPTSVAVRKHLSTDRDARDLYLAVSQVYEQGSLTGIPRAHISSLRAEADYLRAAASYLQSALERHAEERRKALQAVVDHDGSAPAEWAVGSVTAELVRIITEIGSRRVGRLALANSEETALRKRLDAQAAALGGKKGEQHHV